ncbi:uncharacterized protein LOC123327229 [Drosophila simulans]|uniref:uncharacterized protein LOC123327229 n=1 Tax=Drosophila simulans TaxID=7240 RepID=UPI001D101A02|nr:uncharacterized protein LOC123327229 [Drosophila simulans]
MPTGGYANWLDFYSMFTTIIYIHPDLISNKKRQHLSAASCLMDTALVTIRRSLNISDGNYAIFQAHVTEILGLRAMQIGSVSMLRELSDKFNAHIGALNGMGSTEQIAGCIIAQVLVQKLDPARQAKWEEHWEDPVFKNANPTWEFMASFLKQRCRSLENMEFAMASFATGSQVGCNRTSVFRRSAPLATSRLQCFWALHSSLPKL